MYEYGFVMPGRPLKLEPPRNCPGAAVETRSAAAMLRDASRAVADASRVIDDIDRTLAKCRREHRSAAPPDDGRPPPGTPIEHRICRILSVH
jgi:hypothetical protein